ncbi:PfkB family carbohydrate kinase [Wansuia hejianensis]|uniref:Tagatose-6-phosphate kinase n=2 Tax=Bacteria TaxID=2 RepID=A0A926IMM5_9FIRM|nr:PfkB family carbohydrate kinase [Wansuia hejianensis]MBC8591344.1 hypothetical protein [Wansuia hejianensis]
MILTIALDPILESKYYINNPMNNIDIRPEEYRYNIDGEGICTGIILKNHNVNVFTTGFLGGLKGEYIFYGLKELKIYNDFIFIKDETKGRIIINNSGDISHIIDEESPRITREELGSFYKLYNKIIDNCEIICALGSLPQGVPEGIFFDLIEMGNRKNKKIILNGKGSELIYGLEASPFMVILDKDDLENISRVRLNFENEIIKVGKAILEKGIELVVIDLEDKGTIVLTKEAGFRLEIPNAKDLKLNMDKGYLAAGYTFGMDKRYDFETTMRLGQGFRIAYGLVDDLGSIEMSDIKRIMTEVQIMPISY